MSSGDNIQAIGSIFALPLRREGRIATLLGNLHYQEQGQALQVNNLGPLVFSHQFIQLNQNQ